MSIHIGDIAPDFAADTTTGRISFHDWIGRDWVFFFSHPGDFTLTCAACVQDSGGRDDRIANPMLT